MKRVFLAAAGAILLSACADVTAPAPRLQPVKPANAVNSTTVPSVLETVNPCNGDAVTLTGTLTTTTRDDASASGNQHSSSSIVGSYSGVGVPSGVDYTARTENTETFHSNNPYPMVDEVSSVYRIISATSADNYTVRVRQRVTINANGVPTVDTYTIKSSCNG